MKVVVIKREVYEKRTFLAGSLFRALAESKRLGLELMNFLAALRYMLSWLLSEMDGSSKLKLHKHGL